MIDIEHRDLARFRAAVRRCVAGRPRGLAPPVVLQQGKDGLTLSAALEETTLALRLSTASGPIERLVVPFGVLASLEGPGGGGARFERIGNDGIRCHWSDRGETKEVSCEPVPRENEPAALPPVEKLQVMSPSLLPALHACGQTASRNSGGRLALSRLQLRGQDGAIAGSDGHQLLLWRGFTFPFQENLLVPAIPLFGGRELSEEQEARLGRTEHHVAIAAGPWMVWLAVDSASHYTDVMAVLPRSSRLAKLVMDDADATAVLQSLQKRPTIGDEVLPVVLDLGAQPVLRGPEESPGGSEPLPLYRSTYSGPATAVRLDPKYLARALALGLRELRFTSGEAPLLFRDAQRCYLVAPFGPAPAPIASSADRPALPAPSPAPSFPHQGEEPMNLEKDGGPPTERPPAEAVLDPLTEAEALRAALAEVVRRVGRLILSLRQLHKQRRALQAAWTSLKHLRLGPWEEP